MSLLTQLPIAKENLKNDLVSFFQTVGVEKTIEQSAEEIANIIMENVYDFVIEAVVKIPSLSTNVSVPNVTSGSDTASGTGSTTEDEGTLE